MEIGKRLENNKTLKILKIKNLRIDPEGATEISKGLSTNTTLEELTLIVCISVPRLKPKKYSKLSNETVAKLAEFRKLCRNYKRVTK